jgi:hypothetical protein
MDYGGTLRRAWQITWRYRILWAFGLLAGMNAQFRLNLQADSMPPEAQRWLRQFFSSPAFIPVMVGAGLFFLIVGLVFAALQALGHSALVDQVNQIEDGSLPTLRAGWEAGKRHVWQVFLIVLLLGLPAGIVLLAGMLPFFVPLMRDLVRHGPGAVPDPDALMTRLLACFAPACCLGVILSIGADLIRQLAVRIRVLEGWPVWQSITGGWEFLRHNLGQVGTFWLIVLGIRIGVGLVVAIPMCLLAVGMVAPFAFLMNTAFPVAVAGLCGVAIVFWVLGTAINSVIETFFSASWTLAYREIRGVAQAVEEIA